MPKLLKSYPQSFMTDTVAYAKKHGDSEASVQFGVSIVTVKIWKKRYRSLPSVSKYKKKKAAVKNKVKKSAPPIVVKAKEYDEHEIILLDWLEQSMILNRYPSLTQIGQKAKEFGLKVSLHSKHGATYLVRKSYLYRKWSVGANLRLRSRALQAHAKTEDERMAASHKVENFKSHKLAASANHKDELAQKFRNDVATNHKMDMAANHDTMPICEVPEGEINTEAKHKTKMEAKRIVKRAAKGKQRNQTIVPINKRMEAELEAWVSQCIESHHRPTLRTISLKGREIAKRNSTKQCPASKNWANAFLRRHNLTERWRKSLYEEKKNVKPAESFHSIIEDEMLAWIISEYSDGDLPPQQLFLDKAQEVACKLEIQDFTATDRWFRMFMERNQHLIKTSPVLPLSPSDGRQSNQMQQSVTVLSSSHYPTTNGQAGMFGYSPLIADVHTSPVKVKRESSMYCTVASRSSAVPSDFQDRHARNSVIPGVSNSHGGILTVKRGFGSFHSSNLDEQLKFADSASYGPPQMPVRPPAFEEYSSSPFKFGLTARKKHFYFEQGCIFLNQGAFGGTLKEALDFYHDWQIYAESQPLRFFDRILFPQIVHAQKRLANFIGCKAADIALTSNVTTAINAVLQGLTLNEDSSIYYLNVTYGAVKKMIKHICLRTGAKAIEIKVTLPISNSQDIVSLVRSTLKCGTTLAVFDHIPSNYAFIMPVRELTSVAHQKGVPVLIDGAHGLGQLHLDLTILGADYYAGNCHKWFCAPKGCAFLYVNKQLQRYTRGLTISHGYDEGFHSQFTWTGAKDYCSYLSLHALINFWTAVGPDKIRQYCKSLLKKVVDYFSTKWDAELLAPLECHGMMCCISLPSILFSGKAEVSYADAEAIQNRLYFDFDIEVPIKCIENRLYVRISAHIYNEFPEYASLASALLAIANPKS